MKNSTKYLIYEGLIVVAILLLLFFSLPSCRTVYRDIHHSDTLYIGHNSTDTIKIKDSIHIFGKNDTIYQDRWHFEYIYKDKTDTVYKNRVDTVKVPQIEKQVVEVERKLKWFEKFLIYFGLISLLGLLCFVFCKFKK